MSGLIPSVSKPYVDAQLALKQSLSEKDQPSGYLGINADGTIDVPMIQLFGESTDLDFADLVPLVGQFLYLTDINYVGMGDGVTVWGIPLKTDATVTLVHDGEKTSYFGTTASPVNLDDVLAAAVSGDFIFVAGPVSYTEYATKGGITLIIEDGAEFTLFSTSYGLISSNNFAANLVFRQSPVVAIPPILTDTIEGTSGGITIYSSAVTYVGSGYVDITGTSVGLIVHGPLDLSGSAVSTADANNVITISGGANVYVSDNSVGAVITAASNCNVVVQNGVQPQWTEFLGKVPSTKFIELIDAADAAAVRDAAGASSGNFPLSVIDNVRPNPAGIFQTSLSASLGPTITADRIVWQPVYANKAGTAMVVNFNLHGYAAAGKKMKAFLYSVNADGTIGSHVATSNELTVDSSLGSGGFKPLTITTTIARGWYYVGLVSDGAPGIYCAPGYDLWGWGASSLLGSYITAHTYADAAPASPSVTTVTANETAALRVSITT